MLSKTCTRILRPYGFEDVHAPLPAQYALHRSIRLMAEVQTETLPIWHAQVRLAQHADVVHGLAPD